MTDETDITTEAVGIMHKRLGSTPFPGDLQSIVDDADLMIEALFQRCTELEARLSRLRQDRPFVIGWNDGFEHGLKEAASIIGRYDEESTCPSCCDVTAINEEVTALIEGEQP